MDEFFDKVKAGLGKTVDTAEKYTKKAAEKTSDLVNKAKYIYAIKTAENKKSAVFAELGEHIYNEYAGDTSELPEDVAELFKQVDALNEEIESLNAKIEEL